MKEVKATLVCLSKENRQVNSWEGEQNPRSVILEQSPEMIHIQAVSASAVRRVMYLCSQNTEEKQNQWKYRRFSLKRCRVFYLKESGCQ